MEQNQEHGRAEGHTGARLGAGFLEAESWRQSPSVPMNCSSPFPATRLFVTGLYRSSLDTRDHVNTALSATIPWEPPVVLETKPFGVKAALVSPRKARVNSPSKSSHN